MTREHKVLIALRLLTQPAVYQAVWDQETGDTEIIVSQIPPNQITE